jgi:nicotinate dehydrogenase subunit B
MSEERLEDVLADHGLPLDLLLNPRIDRRGFITALGGGVAVLILFPRLDADGQRRGAQGPTEIGGWIHIGEDGQVTAYVGKVELGQNARTSLSMVVAEELRLEAASVNLVMADTAITPFDAGTSGSRTTPYTVPPLRKAAAAARELLIGLAAEQLGVDRGQLAVADRKVTHAASNRSLGFGELTKGQKLVQPIPGDVPETSPADWRVVGHPTPKVDALTVVTGQKRFASDFKRPQMLQGKVLRPPAMKASLTSVDTSGAEALPGVVVHREGDFVGVAAPTEQAAVEAMKAIRAEWDRQTLVTPDKLYEHLKATAGASDRGGQSVGSMADGLAQADVKLQQSYTVAFVAHAAIEPRSAVAEWNGDNLMVWTSTQSPFGVRSSLSRLFGLPESQVRVIAPDTGNGYGGKTPGQAAHEAARLAKVAGRPVRVAWTREEEMTWPHFRPAGVVEITSGARKDGTLVAWEYHNYNSGPAALGTPYNVPNQVVQYHPCDSPLSQGAYRGLAAPANIWARESHMDELAHALGLDPLEFRLRNLSNDRLRAVLQAAAERFEWDRAEAGDGRGFGLGCGIDKGGYTATCASVRVDPATRQVHVERLVTAFECGAVINPLQLENQIIGAATMALGPALFEALEFDEYRLLNASYSRYRLPRFSDVPHIEAVLVDRKDLPSAGAGETPFAGIAPAIGNAIFRATGARIRQLPMAPDGVPA